MAPLQQLYIMLITLRCSGSPPAGALCPLHVGLPGHHRRQPHLHLHRGSRQLQLRLLHRRRQLLRAAAGRQLLLLQHGHQQVRLQEHLSTQARQLGLQLQSWSSCWLFSSHALTKVNGANGCTRNAVFRACRLEGPTQPHILTRTLATDTVHGTVLCRKLATLQHKATIQLQTTA